MDKLFQKNLSDEGEHPARETLLLFVDGEISSKEAAQVQAHLEACWHCRVRTKKIEETIADIIEFDEKVLTPRLLPPNNWRGFEQRLGRLAAEGGPRSLLSKWFGRLARLFSAIRLSSVPRPLVRVAAALAVAVIAVALAVRFNRETVVSASELLQKSSDAQAARVSKTAQPVVHQQLIVRRKGAALTGTDSFNWEIWNDTTGRRFRQSVADGAGRRFVRAAAADVSSDPEAAPPPPVLSEVEAVLLANHMDPRRPLSPTAYQAWRNSLGQKQDEVTKSRSADGAEVLILRTVPTEPVGEGRLAEAALVVRSEDWHPQELRLKVPAEGAVREYELVETSFEVVSLTAVGPEIFPERPAEIASGPAPGAAPAASPSPSPAEPVSPTQPSRPAASAELEMEVLRLLSDAGADLGEQVSVERTPGGLLRVAGIVETGERKAEILRALGPVTDNPAVLIEIRTVAEALAEKKGQGAKPATEQKVEIQSGSMAAESDLRSYFGGEEQARAFAARMVARSRRAVSHLYTLKNLSTRFSKDQLQRLSPEARGRWLSLLRSHAHAYRLEAEGLRQELRPVFFPSAPQGGAAAGPTPADIDGVVRAIDQLFAQGSANDRVILSAFTTSAQGATVTAIRAPQFWQSLLDAEGLAARIESAQ